MFPNPDIINCYRYALLAGLLLSCSTLTHAQTGDEHKGGKLEVLIDEGRVVAGIGEVNLQTTSSAYTVISAERLRKSFTSLSEVLTQEVGVQARQTGGAGSLTTIVLRGLSNEQVIIYLDGVPLNDASGGPVDLSFIPVSSIERIEIYRGSTPIELGAPSIGGGVNIITRQYADAGGNQQKNYISASVGSFDTYKLSGTSSFSANKNDFLLSASYLQSENDFSFTNNNGTEFSPADDNTENRNNDGVKHLAILANWKREYSNTIDTEVRLNLLDREKGIPGVTNSADVKAKLDTQQYDFLAQLNLRQIYKQNINLNLKLFASRKDEVFDDTLAQIGFINQHSESVTDKIGTQFYTELNQQQMQWKLLTNISRETYSIESTQALSDSGENTRDHFELSVENISYFNQRHFILNFVLRYQLIDDDIASTSDAFGVVTPALDNRFEFLNPQLGAKYRFNRSTFLTANIGVYNRAPSFFELFGGEGLLIGNVELKQEKSLNTDIGFTYTWFESYRWFHNSEIYAGVFYNKIEDLIVRIYNGQGIGVPKNISDAVVQGFESTIKLTPSERHSINANLTLIDSVNTADVASFNGKSLPGYYQQSLGLRYMYTLKRWSYGAEADIKRNMFYDRSNLLEGDDVNLFNVSIGRAFHDSNVELRINNLADENIEYFRNRPTPGINLSLTYNHSF